MIKYLGSKRIQVPLLGAIAEASGAKTAVDLFTGTTRVAQEFKRRGILTTAVDLATYSEVFAQCYIATDARAVDERQLRTAIDELNRLPGRAGYFTRTFCEESRFFQPKNGARIDTIRAVLESDYRSSPLFPLLLTSLLEAADRVDSTTGLQMAFLKQWAPRAANELELRVPQLLPGSGVAVRGDAIELAASLPAVDLAYLDPPYNQHRYFSNYHVWETLVRWDEPEPYGVARKRLDVRSDENRSAFNSRRTMSDSLRHLISEVRAETIVVSYNNESWVSAADISGWLRDAGKAEVMTLDVDYKRYVGAQIGIHNPAGEKVGKVSHLRNVEHVIVGGSSAAIAAVREALEPVAGASSSVR